MVPKQSDDMTAITATRSSPKTPGPWSSSQSRPKSTTTSAGIPARTPGQQRPGSASKALSPHGKSPLHASSPNYFDFLSDPDNNPPNSNAGIHAKKNWSPTMGVDHPPSATPPDNYALEHQPKFQNFRRESESSAFRLSHGSLRQFSTGSGIRISTSRSSTGEPNQGSGSATHSPASRASNHSAESPNTDPRNSKSAIGGEEGMEVDCLDRIPDSLADVPRQPLGSSNFFGDQRRDSPANDSTIDLSDMRRSQLSHIDERHPRNSLPHNRADPALPNPVQRSETLPSSTSTDGPTMISPNDVVGIIEHYPPEDILLLDLRVFPQYSKSRIAGALNLCIPTTLLKRASFTIQRLAETFTKESERAKFDEWPNSKVIIVYDNSSNQLQDAVSCINISKKFTLEDWDGATYILRGGFNTFSKKFPDQIDKRPAAEMDGSNIKGLSIKPPASAPIAGGCAMPPSQTAANPFFGTIRQNMDLIDGVGQIPVTVPSVVRNKPRAVLPAWLREVSSPDDKGKTASDNFLSIEKAEEQRMKKALSVNTSYDASNPLSPNNIQVAGIEKGLKNRYKDILPFDHTRVKLQGISSGDCDYVNASHVQASGSNKRYIASQAPVPATFQVFSLAVYSFLTDVN